MSFFAVDGFEAAAQSLCQLTRQIASRGWCPATSGNMSCRLNEVLCLITPSGVDKSQLQPEQCVCVDGQGRVYGEGKPSAETRLHTQLYAFDPKIAAVLHVHSPLSTVLSMCASDAFEFKGYEIQKAFRGITDHQMTLRCPIVENHADCEAMLAPIQAHLTQNPCWGYLIRGHGLYTWGYSLAEAWRHLEALHFLLECAGLHASLQRNLV